jgi:alanyl-tRNA synthetase
MMLKHGVKKMTDQLYLQDTYLFEFDAHIIESKKDENGASYILLDRTIFYPQGGGQPTDHGIIAGENFKCTINNVRQVNDEICHYITNDLNAKDLPEHCAVKCISDKDRRVLNARYHTAGHLLGNVVEEMYKSLKAQKCHAFPGEAHIEFRGDEIPNKELLRESLQNTIAKNLQTKIFEIDRDEFESTYYKLPYEIPENKKFRAMQIGNYPPIPCGGTHLASTSEIGEIILSKMKVKNGILKISFGVT